MKRTIRETIDAIAAIEPSQRVSIDKRLHVVLILLLVFAGIAGTMVGYVIGDLFRLGEFVCILPAVLGGAIGIGISFYAFLRIRMSAFNRHLDRLAAGRTKTD